MKDATSYLLREFLGIDTELDFLDGLSSGALSLEPDDLDRRRVLSRAHLLAAGLLIGSRARPVRGSLQSTVLDPAIMHFKCIIA